MDLLVLAIIGFVFRMIMVNAKKQNEVRRKAEREEQGDSQAPRPVEPSKPRGLGGWADMLGKLTNGEAPVFEKPAVAPTPWRNDAAFPPAPPPVSPPALSSQPSFQIKEPVFKEYISKEPVSAEGVDTCRDDMLTGPVLETSEPDAVPVRFDAPALVKGVIFAEVLARPAQRRRPGMPRMR